MKFRQRFEMAIWFLLVDVLPSLAFGVLCYVVGYQFGLSAEVHQ